jgi:glycosyltransferase involved in cell wall biosynthesis
MDVLVFHGYLLRGTGSNVYNAELAQALAGRGHHVHLLCQDRAAADLEWVDAAGEWRDGQLEVARLREPTGPGSITTYVPDIAGLLPVYVYDEYEGFDVKTYPDLSDDELERYISLNAEAVSEVAERCGGPGAALANHLVAGPAILARAGLRFAAKIHGSDLSYTVRPHPERFVPLAREGMEAASAALVGSFHTAEDLWNTLGLEGLRERTRLGPPGVDVESFRPLPAPRAEAGMRELAQSLAGEGSGSFGRDAAEGAAALEWFAGAPAARILFVGKFLVNKGVDLLLAAWPLVVRDHPDARLLLTGFGAFRGGMERLWDAITAGDLEGAREVAEAGRRLEEAGEEGSLRLLGEFLAEPPEDYAEAGVAAAGSVRVSGRLEHSEVAVVVPAVDALVMPSTFPEAFGMVAAEAAAAGALPVSAAHSGMAEVSAALASVTEPEIARLLSFPVEDDPVRGIASRLSEWLSVPPERRREIGASLAERIAGLWSWESVAAGVIAASAGDLEGLPRPRPAPE